MGLRSLLMICVIMVLITACGSSAAETEGGQPDPEMTAGTPVGSAVEAYPAAGDPAGGGSVPTPEPGGSASALPQPYPAGGEQAPAAYTLLTYTNSELKYELQYPEGWQVNEDGLSQASKEVIFSPPQVEAFTIYFSVSIDGRDLQTVRQSYEENNPEAIFSEVVYAGQPAVMYTFENRVELFVPYQDRLYLLFSDQPQDPQVASIFGSFQFLP